MKTHSELKLVTCLFIDIVGSTDAVVRLGPERMQRLLSDGFAQISGMIKAHGGSVEKYIGDAILATFGIPVARPDDAERALRAAEAATRWAAQWAAAGGLNIRAGIETGDLLIDSQALETQQRMVIGEAINLAARLQSSAQPGQIVVGPGCHEGTASIARFVPLGELELKGFGSVAGWQFDGFNEQAASSEVGFVGREPELETVAALIDRARSGSPALALLIGPPGQGKSRLAREALRRARDVRILEARCRPGGEAGANSPLRQLIEAEVGVASADALRERLEVLVGAADGPEIATTIAHGAGLLVDDTLLSMSRWEQREAIARAWERYLSRVTATSPVALLVEDVHWGDPQLLRVIDYLASSAVGALVVVATARPEFVDPRFQISDGRLRLELEPLDAEAAAQLAGLVTQQGGSDAELVERAAGNPLFLIELARVRPAEGHLPMTIQAAIAARLDELEDDDRHLLQHASVAGGAFTIRDAALLDDREPASVVGSIARAAQLGFVAADGAGYRFNHALIRDVVYGRLTVVDRMGLHARYATDGVDPADPEARAYHWWEALKPPDAAWVWADVERLAAMRAEAYRTHVDAARRAERHNGYEQAADLNLRAIELADSPADRATAEAEAGRMYARQGRGDEGWAHRKRALELYAEAGMTPPATVYASMLELIAFNWGYFHDLPAHDEILALLAAGERVARESGDATSLAMLLAERESYLDEAPPIEEMQQLLARPDAVAMADGLQRMATAAQWSGRSGDALPVFEAVFERLLPAGGQVFNRADARFWYGVAAFTTGDLQRARRIVDALDEETEYLSTHTRSHYFSFGALVAFGAGDWGALAQANRDLLELAERYPTASFCLASACAISLAAAREVLDGRPLRPDLDAQVQRQVDDSELIRDAATLLPKVMAGDTDAVARGLRSYERGLLLSDRFTVWDPIELMPAIAMTMLGRWDDLARPVARLDAAAANGSRLASASAAAIREEERAAAGGPPPMHADLEALGFQGISEMLRFRPGA